MNTEKEARKKAQAAYYQRRKAGYKASYCISCGARLKIDSKHAPICWACWYKTPEGRLYLKERQKDCRAKKKQLIKLLTNNLSSVII